MSVIACVPDEGFLRGLPPDVTSAALFWPNFASAPPKNLNLATMLVVPPGSKPLTTEFFVHMPELRAVQLLTHGFETWSSAVPREADLCVARGLHAASTAEMAVGLLLYHVLNVPRLQADHRQHCWRPVSRGALLDKRILVLGSGDIGRRVAKALTIMGASTTLVGRRPGRGVLPVDRVIDLLPSHNVLVIAAPLSRETRGMVDGPFLALLPDDSIVINVGRGPIIDTNALTKELQTGRIKAGLDVTDPEPLPPNHPLWKCANLLVTPHLGGETPGWMDRARELVGENIARHAAGLPLRGRVSMTERNALPCGV